MTQLPNEASQIAQEVVSFYTAHGITFQQIFWDESKSLLLFQETMPSHSMELLSSINTIPLVKTLRGVIPSFSNDDIILYSNGYIGIIIRSTSTEEKISELPIELYVNIAKNLDENSIDELCITNKEFKVLCDSNEFWRRLLTTRFGEKAIKDDTYDYRKIYKGFLRAGGKNELYNYMSAVKELHDIKDLINLSKPLADAIIYVFNIDSTFKDIILINKVRSFNTLITLALSGNLDEAQKFVDLYKSLHQKPPMSKNVRSMVASYPITHNYSIIDFVANNYPGVIGSILSTLKYDPRNKFLSEPDLRKLLMDKRFKSVSKDKLLMSFAGVLTYDQFMNNLNIYRIGIDKTFLTQYLSNVIRGGGKDRLNKIKIMLNNFSDLMTFEDIKQLLSMVTVQSEEADFDEEDFKLIRLLINSKPMSEKLGE
jgi:hypothetical protein